MQIAQPNVIYPQRWNYLGLWPEIGKSLIESGLSPFAAQGANRLGHAIFGNTVAEDEVAQRTRDAQQHQLSTAIREGANAQEVARRTGMGEDEAQQAINTANPVDATGRTGSQAGGIASGNSQAIPSGEMDSTLGKIGATPSTAPAQPTVDSGAAQPEDANVRITGSPTQDLTGVDSSTPPTVAPTSPTDSVVKVVPDNPPPAVLPSKVQSAPTLDQTAAATNVQAQASSPMVKMQVASALQDPDIRQKASLYLLHSQGLMAQLQQNVSGQMDPNDTGKSEMMANMTAGSYNSFLTGLEAQKGIATPNLQALGPAGASKLLLATQAKDPTYIKFLAQTQGQQAANTFVQQGKAYDAELQPVMAKMSPPEMSILSSQAMAMQQLGATGIDQAQKYAQLDYQLAAARRVATLTDPEKRTMEAGIPKIQAETGVLQTEIQKGNLNNQLLEKTLPYSIALAKLEPQYKQALVGMSEQQLHEQELTLPLRYSSLQMANSNAKLGLGETQLKMALAKEQVVGAQTANHLKPAMAAQTSMMKQLSDNTATIKDLQDNIQKYDANLATNAYTTDEAKTAAMKDRQSLADQLKLFNSERTSIVGQLRSVNQGIGEYSPDKTHALRENFTSDFAKDPTYWSLRTSQKPEYFPGSAVADNLSRAGTQLGQTKQALPTPAAFTQKYQNTFLQQSNNDPVTANAKMKYAYSILQAAYKDANLGR